MPVVQSAPTIDTFSTTHTITFASAVGSGNGIRLTFGKGVDAITIVSVQDNTGTDLIQDFTTDFGTDSRVYYYRLDNITDAPTSVTITVSSTTGVGAVMHEVSGVSGTIVQTIAATADGEGFSTSHSWEYTADSANDFAIFMGSPFGGFPEDDATATGNTVVQQINRFSVQCYEFAPGSGAQSATWDVVNSRSISYSGVVYAAGGGGGGGGSIVLMGQAIL